MTPEEFDREQRKPFAMNLVCYSGVSEDGVMDSFALPFQNGKAIASGAPNHIEDIYETARQLNDLAIPFTLQNGVYDCSWFLYYGLPLRNYAYDTMTLWWSKYPDLPRRLDFISSVLLDDYQYWKGGRKSESMDEHCHYGMDDTESTLRNTVKLLQMATDDEKMRVNFFHAHLRSLAGLHMSALGLAVEESVMDQIKETLDVEAKKTLEKLRYLVADPDFNPNSAPQKKHLLHSILGAPMRNAKGRSVKRLSDASTGAVPLRAIKSDHPLFRRVADGILEAITPSKQISNVVGIARFKAGSSGSRFLTSYDAVGTTTSRFSSRASALGFGGNAQNIRKNYRRFAKADTGHFLLEIDFSASDDVFVAFESREPGKIELVRSGRDTHAVNALIFFSDWTYERIVDGKHAKDPAVVHPITGVRQITKKVVHGTHYLMAGLTLLSSAGREAIVAAAIQNGFDDAGTWSQDRLVRFCDFLSHKFRMHYPRFQLEHDSVDSWYRELRREVVSTGGFMTPFRYFQRFSSDPHDDATLRAVAATAGQAGTAGRINMVMDELVHGYIPRSFRDGPNPEADDKPRLVGNDINGISIRLQTHDSISFDVNPMHPNWLQGLEDIFYVFRRPVYIYGEEVRVGIEADASIYWAGKETATINNPIELLKPDDDGINWMQKMSLEYDDRRIA